MEQRRKRREALKAKSKSAAKPAAAKPAETKKPAAKKDTSKTHVNRYATLKEHRAAVAARKTLQGGKNKGPVANADAYGSTIKKKPTAKTPSKAPTSSSKTPKTTPKPTRTKPTGKGGPKTSGGYPTTAVTRSVHDNRDGTYGKPLPSNPNLKGKQKQTGRQKIQAEVNANVGGRITSPGYKPTRKKRKGSDEGRAAIKAMVDSYGGNKKKDKKKK